MKNVKWLLIALLALSSFGLLPACGGKDLDDEARDYRKYLDKLAPDEAAALEGLKFAADAASADQFIESISSKTAPDLEAVKIKLAAYKPLHPEILAIQAFHLQALDAYLNACRLSRNGVIDKDRARMAEAGQAAVLGDRLLAEAKKQLLDLFAELKIEG